MNNRSVNIRLLLPLLMFYIDRDTSDDIFPFDLGSGFRLERIDKSEVVAPLLERATTISDYEKSQIMGFSTFAIMKDYQIPNLELGDLMNSPTAREADESTGLIRMALGLSKPNHATFPTFHYRLDDGLALRSRTYNNKTRLGDYTNVSFNIDDLYRLKHMISVIEPLKSSYARLMNACVYFDTARLSTEYIVRFVMFVSVLEALFNSGTDHITETIALRSSLLLSNDAAEKIDYYQRVKKLYKLRSILVHGQRVPSTILQADTQKALMDDADLIARKCILSVIDDSSGIFSLGPDAFNRHFASQLLQ